MQSIDDQDVDSIFLVLQRELMKNAGRRDSEEMGATFHGPGFSINLPSGFETASNDKASIIYYSKNRPDILFFQPDGHAGITLQPVSTKHSFQEENLKTMRDEMRQTLKCADKKIVFYDEGEVIGDICTLWFDYKSFANNGLVYNLMFLFFAGNRVIMGTFYCIFKDYDRWKLDIMDMLRTIHSEEEGNERL